MLETETDFKLHPRYPVTHSLSQHLLNTYCMLGPEMDTVLGTENRKMRDKVKEL